MAEPLMRDDKEMQLLPINHPSFAKVRELLWRDKTVHVILEPGDWTRYTMLLARIGQLLWVVRTRTSGSPWSDAIGAMPISLKEFAGTGRVLQSWEVEALTAKHPWTAIILIAFFTQLLEVPIDGTEA